MDRVASNTHGQVLAGVGGTPAGETSLGIITLPAGGPWTISGAFAQCVPATCTPAEIAGGHVRIASPSGDIAPNPAPLKIPSGYAPSQLGATAPTQACPLSIYPLDLIAAGKSTLEFFGTNDVALTVAPQWLVGIIYGLEMVDQKPAHWYDQVRANNIGAAAAAIGTITLSEGATEIVSITCIIAQSGVLTAAEELIGYISLSSDDLKIQPLQLPFSSAIGAGLGVTVGNPAYIAPVPIACSIPVQGGARIDVVCDLNTAITGAASCKVIIGYR